jgi:hypothetical protein
MVVIRTWYWFQVDVDWSKLVVENTVEAYSGLDQGGHFGNVCVVVVLGGFG